MLLNTVKTQARSLANGHYLLIPLLFWILAGIAGCSGGGSGGSTPKTPLGAATITGTVQYQDKEYGSGGFTSNILTKAVRYALIEVVDPSDGAVLGSTRTSSTGAYSAAFTFYGDMAYVRVISDARITGGNPVKVRNLSGALYAVRGSDVTASSGAPLTANITVNATGAAGGAFNILDVLTSGFEFVSSLSGTYPPTLSAFWQENSAEGTYYCTGCSSPGDGIYVIGNSGGDTDGYDDDVVWHEFGHFIADKFSRDESPGGYHILGDNAQDLRLSWSEGWGNFFPGAVKQWLTINSNTSLLSTVGLSPSEYVDTDSTGVYIYFNFGNPGGAHIYSSSEVAVAKVLWDIMNGTGNFGMQPIWNVVSSSQFKATTPVNLETFWDGWLTVNVPTTTDLDKLNTIFGNRLIAYVLDSFETDNAIISASAYTVGATALQNRTLYSNSDEDYVVFSAATGTTYSIVTSNLRNGADTYMMLYASGQSTVLAANDNASNITYIACPATSCNYNYYDSNDNYIFPANNTTNLASKIVFTPSASGIYYVSIKSSPNRPLSAGRYGAYTLTITSP